MNSPNTQNIQYSVYFLADDYFLNRPGAQDHMLMIANISKLDHLLMSLVRNQGFKNFLLMQQKMAAGESPAAEMIKSVSLIIAGLLLLLPGFFTDFLGLLLLLPPVQKHLTMKLMPHLRFSRMPGGGFSAGTGAGTGGGETFEGEFQRKDEQRDRLDHKDDRRD